MLEPNAVIGLLGGGQLGRMLAIAAAPLGLRVAVYAPEEGPAFDVAALRFLGAYEDEARLDAFASACAVVTYEFENVPAATAAFLAARRPIRPGPDALATTQDRLAEKTFLAGLGIPLAAFRPVDGLRDLAPALDALGSPCVLKTRRFGYDGKGQAMIRGTDDIAQAHAAIGGAPAVLEALVPFAREVSVVAARGPGSAFAAYDPCENEHREGILARTLAPARIGAAAVQAAVDLARRIGEALDYCGVFTVEMFVVGEAGDERLLVNEIAPRVHNSGHWTIEGARTSQFEQHVRAVAGWPLGDPARLAPRVEMRNLIGEEVGAWRTLAAEPGAHLHLYGKAESRPGRKMGHVTRLMPY